MVKKRESLQDVLNEGTFLFGKLQKFTDAFPEIQDVKIEYRESGFGTTPRHFPKISGEDNTYSITNKDYLAEYIRCPNPMCVHGGFNIGDKIREMVAKKITTLECYIGCCGNEGSPKGRKIYRPCRNSITAKIMLSYKE